MSEVKYLSQDEQSILLMDFSAITDYSGLPGLVREAIRLTQSSNTRHSVRALIDLSGTPIRRPVIDALESLSKNNGPFMKAVVFVGLSTYWSLLVTIFLKSAGRRNHRVMQNREQAMRWLALQ